MIAFLLSHATTVLAIVTCGLAAWRGRAPEREAAALVGGAWLISIAAQIFCSRAWFDHALVVEPYLIALVDGLVGAGFLALMLRHASPWLGVAVLVQGAALALHAAFLTGDGLDAPSYVVRINILGGLLLLLLLGATLFAWARRGRRADPAPLAEGGARLAG